MVQRFSEDPAAHWKPKHSQTIVKTQNPAKMSEILKAEAQGNIVFTGRRDNAQR